VIDFELHIKIPCKARNEDEKEEIIRLTKAILQNHFSQPEYDKLCNEYEITIKALN
jgi:hypothetical protein